MAGRTTIEKKSTCQFEKLLPELAIDCDSTKASTKSVAKKASHPKEKASNGRHEFAK